MQKDQSITQLIDYILTSFEDKVIVVADHWEEDAFATGFTNNQGKKLVYVSTISGQKDSLYVALEFESNDTDLPYAPGPEFENVTEREILNVIRSHLF